MRTYKDSYLYKNKTRKITSDESKNNKALSNYIMQAERVDKSSDAFRGVYEDIKRRQTSSIVYTILKMDRVVLCMGTYELPRSFKVFEAADIRYDKKPKVFIDVTGIMEYQNGYYVCKKVDVLTAYLYNALVYLLYRYAFTRVTHSTEIITSGAKCYASLFTYIIDFLRIIGYAENRNKIMYVAALFYLNHHLDKPIDSYAKNIAAKVAGITTRDSVAYDLYVNDIDFTDIKTFTESVAETFRLKDFGLEVFVSKWVFLIGTGTQYATELFTNFAILLASAYSGAYIVNQKQIERSCGSDMIAFNNALKKIGIDTFERGNSFRESYNVIDKNTEELRNVIASRITLEEPKVNPGSFSSIEETMKLSDAIKKFYKQTQIPQALPDKVVNVMKKAITIMEHYVMEDKDVAFQEGSVLKFAQQYRNIFNAKYIDS